MESRRFYTSPVNHHDAADWNSLAARLEAAVRSCDTDVSVTLGTEPVFRYGLDGFDAFDDVADRELPSREVRIDFWTSIVLYESLCIAFGAGISEKQRNAIVLRLEEGELAGEALLRVWEGPYDEDAPQIYGYSFAETHEEEDMEAIDSLTMPLDTPIYIAERAVIAGEDGAVDENAFEVFAGGEVAMFVAKSKDAAERVWKARTRGHGVIAMYGDDPAEHELLSRFSDLDDLRILMHEKPCAGMRVTLGRCHADDDLVVVYTPPDEPYIDHPLLFAI